MVKSIDKKQSEQIKTLQKKLTLKAAITPVAAMVCIVVLEVYALSRGINGKMLAFVIAILAGLGGFQIGKYKEIVKSILKEALK